MLNMLEGCVYGEAKYGCHLAQTIFTKDIMESFSQTFIFVLGSQAFRFRAKVLLLLTMLSFSQLQIFTHRFLRTYLLMAVYLLVKINH